MGIAIRGHPTMPCRALTRRGSNALLWSLIQFRRPVTDCQAKSTNHRCYCNTFLVFSKTLLLQAFCPPLSSTALSIPHPVIRSLKIVYHQTVHCRTHHLHTICRGAPKLDTAFGSSPWPPASPICACQCPGRIRPAPDPNLLKIPKSALKALAALAFAKTSTPPSQRH